MPSTYTLNNGIELIGTGEQSGTWGDTTNTNFELLDTALDGQVSVTLAATGSSGSPNTLPISDGASSNGRNRLVIFGDGGDLGGTAFVQLTPNDSEKIIYVRNNLSGSRSILLFQGTYSASNDYEVPAGTTAVVFFNGAGTGAVAANVFNNAYFDGLRLGSVSVTAILDEDNMASDSATALATQQSIKAYVDTQVGANNELSEVLANGNTTGGTDISVSSGDDITFADNSKAIFGAGSDLQIYHNGGDSLIADTGAGDLYIRGSNNIFLQKGDGSETFIATADDGAVTLYHDNSQKLATTSTGIDVTGTVTAGGLTVDTTTSTAVQANADAGYSLFNGATNSSGARINISGASAANGIAINGYNAAQNGYTPLNYLAADHRFKIGSSEQMRIDASGNVGIGTSSPSAYGAGYTTVGVNGSTMSGVEGFVNGTLTSYTQTYAAQTLVGTKTATPLIFVTDDTQRMRIKSDGNLQLNGQLHFTDTGSLIARPTTNALSFNTNGSEAMRIDSSGRVGIGTSSIDSNAKLAVSNNGAEGLEIRANSTNIELFAYNRSAATYEPIVYNGLSHEWRNSNGNVAAIDSSGNVGIGTSSPAQVLHLASSAPDLRIEDTDGGYADINVAAGSIELRSDQGNTQANSTLKMFVDGSERMRIDSSGRVAIGDVPKASFTGHSILQVGGQAILGANDSLSTTGQTYLSHNLYFDTSGNYQVFNTGSANEGTVYTQADGVHKWSNSAATTGTPTVTERMRIDSSGNVGIGASPSTKFHVKTGTNQNFNVFGPAVFSNGVTLASTTDGFGAYVEMEQRATQFAWHNGTTERMRLDSSGNVGIGTSSPSANLEVQSAINTVSRLKLSTEGGINAGMFLASPNADHSLGFETNGTERMRIKSSGSITMPDVYNDTTASAANLHISSAGGQLFRSTSSARYKNTIANASFGIVELMALRPVTYKGNNDGDTVFGGLIAEEVHDAGLVEFVQYNEEGEPDALAYGNMVSLCIKAIQEQQATITALTDRITALENA